MATSSITRRFVVNKKKEALKFIRAIERYPENKLDPPEVNGKFLRDPVEISDFLDRLRKAHFGDK